ncbi:NAD(P)/FAD-dependent oxidoreductase [Desulfurobacterium atlanticum]|uniref:Pyridine nucleotide-disulphide oxidoreductase n=1 Tax=Desulfurobacterium atlanticum TaxID=240169 RepID=A0A238ZFQ2_9BACT|nr:FAD-dependent oxidoreductase [Desulfurobacterium atlanticum]SNR81828.1 Pyridine nucleotide-disulphide oxidoreductase [Desulfurobacterium atlanticum]
MKYVIVGNSAAAVGCINGIRKKDKESEIVVITYETEGCYSKPLIADILIDLPLEKLMYKEKSFYEKNNVKLMLGTRAEKINPEKKEIILDSGVVENYDKLLISTGAIPFVPPIEGSDKKGVFTFTELGKAKAAKEYIKNNGVENVVIIGSGFIGLEVAYFLRKKGLNVSVVELLDKVLGKALDNRGSQIVETIMRDKGINFFFKNTVEEIIGEERVEAVRLQSGTVLKAEAVIIAIGVRPNTQLAETAGIKVDGGIDTNLLMETSCPDIYAAGDCVVNIDIIDGKKKNLPLFPLAYEQGFVAGLNMTGEKTEYLGGLPLNSLKFLEETPVLNAGIVEAPDSTYEVIINDQFERRGYYRKAIIKDDRLVGFVAVGEIDRVGILTGIIRQKLDVSSFKHKLADIDFGLVHLPKSWREKRIQQDKTGYKSWRPE